MVLLHGGALPGELCWRHQLPLADRFSLEIVDRAGYGGSQELSTGEDLDADAPLVAEFLGDGAHLVGHSSGAVAAMLAAARAPAAVLSLTLCEPPAFQLLPESAEAQRMARDAEAQLQRAGDDAEWLRGFAASQAAGERLVSEMVISGHHSPVFEAICDSLATCLQAARAHIAGAGHATPDTGDLFNRTLETFIRASAS